MFGLNCSQSHIELKCVRVTTPHIVDPLTDAPRQLLFKVVMLTAVGISHHLKPVLCLHVTFPLPKAKQVKEAAHMLKAGRVQGAPLQLALHS